MAQGSNTSENAKVSQAIEHKGSSLAVSNPQWYIAECKPTKERTIRETLKKSGYEVYVLSQKEKHRYKSGNTRVVEHIILPGKVFVRTEERQLVEIMNTISSVYRFQLNRAAALGKNGVKPFAYVPQSDMEQLMTMLDKSEKPVVITDMKLEVGQEVKITSGPLAGLKGFFCRKGAASYLVIKVELGRSHYAYTEVSIENVATSTTENN